MLKKSCNGILCPIVVLRYIRDVPGLQHLLAREGAARNLRPWLGKTFRASRQDLDEAMSV